MGCKARIGAMAGAMARIRNAADRPNQVCDGREIQLAAPLWSQIRVLPPRPLSSVPSWRNWQTHRSQKPGSQDMSVRLGPRGPTFRRGVVEWCRQLTLTQRTQVLISGLSRCALGSVLFPCAPEAQPDKAPALLAGSYGFDSCPPRHFVSTFRINSLGAYAFRNPAISGCSTMAMEIRAALIRRTPEGRPS